MAVFVLTFSAVAVEIILLYMILQSAVSGSEGPGDRQEWDYLGGYRRFECPLRIGVFVGGLASGAGAERGYSSTTHILFISPLPVVQALNFRKQESSSAA